MPNTSKPACADRLLRWVPASRLLGLSLFSLMVWLGLGRAAPAPGATHVVHIENMQFSPAALSAVAGDRIEFINADLVPHTATATSGDHFDSGVIEPGKSWTVTLTQPSEILYRCVLHPVMKAAITVVAGNDGRTSAAAGDPICSSQPPAG